MVAETEADGRDGAEMFEPSFEAGAFGSGVESVLFVYDVASDENEAGFVGFSAVQDGL